MALMPRLRALRALTPQQIFRRSLFRIGGSVVSKEPAGQSRGRVLMSYTTVPFTLLTPDQIGGHTNYWETHDMATAFLERGYAIDIIDFTDHRFIPRKRYDFCVDIGTNLERLAPILGKDCVKVFHATGAHWLTQNAAEYARLQRVLTSKGVSLRPRRQAPPSRSAEVADIISSLGGDFANESYDAFGKRIMTIQLSSTHTFPFLDRDFESARHTFLWFGGAGAVHKGLDLALEAFAGMPEAKLLVAGKYDGERDFVDAYRRELFETPNIEPLGYVDPSGAIFNRIRNECATIVYPSCSEGCAGSVVLAMHAGLMPILTREAGLRIEGFGTELFDPTVENIQNAVRNVCKMDPSELRARALDAWTYARTTHTRERFSGAYRAFIDELERIKRTI